MVDAIGNSSLGVPVTDTRANNALAQEDFLQIMISELTNQDPLEPLDNSQFLNQLTQMQTLEATNKLTEGLENLLAGQQIASAGSLIGQGVRGVTGSGEFVEGVVERVVINGGDVQLGLQGGELIPISSLREVVSPESLGTTDDASE